MDTHHDQRPVSSSGDTYLLTSSPVKREFDLQSYDGSQHHVIVSPYRPDTQQARPHWADEERDIAGELSHSISKNKNGKDIEMRGFQGLSETNVSKHNLRRTKVNPMISNYTSPIGEYRSIMQRDMKLTNDVTDLAYASADPNESRLTFRQQ